LTRSLKFRCAGRQSEVPRFLGVSLRGFKVFCHKSERGARAKLGRNMVAQAATASAAELTSSAGFLLDGPRCP